MSTAYYAMFHALCRNCVDSLISVSAKLGHQPAWRQVYRAIEHGYAKEQCKRQQVMKKFPDGIRDFAIQFVELQE